MNRLLTVTLLSCSVLAAEDAREIVRKAVKLDECNYERARAYSYEHRVEDRKLDENGRVRSAESKTYLTTLLGGDPYTQLVRHNDQPLTKEEMEREQEKLAKETGAGQKASAKSHARRQKFLRELPEAFDFQLVGMETISGRPVYVINATPRPGYQPADNLAGRILPKIKGKLWIDKADYQWVKAEAEVIEPVAFGLFLARLAPGARVSAEQIHVNNEVWLPRTVNLKYDARVALVKRMNQEMVVTFKDYKKGHAEAVNLPAGRSKPAQN